MTNDDELKLTFKHLSERTAATVREAFRQRAEWKKKKAGAEAPASEPSKAGGVGQGKARGE